MRISFLMVAALLSFMACGPSEREPTFVGNKESKVVHRITCSAVERMKDDNKEMFKTFKKAKGEGYTACDKCEPDKKQ